MYPEQPPRSRTTAAPWIIGIGIIAVVIIATIGCIAIGGAVISFIANDASPTTMQPASVRVCGKTSNALITKDVDATTATYPVSDPVALGTGDPGNMTWTKMSTTSLLGKIKKGDAYYLMLHKAGARNPQNPDELSVIDVARMPDDQQSSLPACNKRAHASS